MLYLITIGRPTQYSNTHLIGSDLIKKVDSILSSTSSDLYLSESLDLSSDNINSVNSINKLNN